MKKTTIPHPRTVLPFGAVQTQYKSADPRAYGISPAKPGYCKRCGQTLLFIVTDENGIPNYTLEEELALGVCHTCYPLELKALEVEMQRQMEEAAKAAEPTEEEKKKADEAYEAAVQKLMDELRARTDGNKS